MPTAQGAPINAVSGDVLRTVRSWPIFTFYIAATLTAATIIGLITVDVIDLGMQHFGEASHRTHDVAYGGLFTTLVLGIVVQLRHPERNVAGMVMALVPSASLLLAALLVDDLDRVFEFNPLRYAAAVAAVTALLHPSGRTFFRSFRLRSMSWPMAAMVAAAAVPLLVFASRNIELQQRAVNDVHRFMGHYGFMSALAFTIVGVGILASLRPAGWQVTACVSALLVAVLGVTSLLYPDAVSSVATGWAVAALAWAGSFATVALRTDQPHITATASPSEPARLAHAG